MGESRQLTQKKTEGEDRGGGRIGGGEEKKRAYGLVLGPQMAYYREALLLQKMESPDEAQIKKQRVESPNPWGLKKNEFLGKRKEKGI